MAYDGSFLNNKVNKISFT